MLPVSRKLEALNLACVAAIVGIWIDKAMGLIVPGFVPTTLGEVVEYTPSLNESLVSFGIWAFVLLLFTVMIKISVPILVSEIRHRERQGGGPIPAPSSG
jgi:molybdopterin-containing oxidoreductase family membrane subunit